MVDEEGEVLTDGFVDEEAGVAEVLHPVEGVVVAVVVVDWGFGVTSHSEVNLYISVSLAFTKGALGSLQLRFQFVGRRCNHFHFLAFQSHWFQVGIGRVIAIYRRVSM